MDYNGLYAMHWYCNLLLNRRLRTPAMAGLGEPIFSFSFLSLVLHPLFLDLSYCVDPNSPGFDNRKAIGYLKQSYNNERNG